MHFYKKLHKVLAKFLLFVLCVEHIEAGILPLTWRTPAETNNNNNTNNNIKEILQTDKFGYIEYKPNGTLILRSTIENGTNAHNLLLLRSVLSAMRLTAPLISGSDVTAGTASKLNIKIYGDGIEHKFPPLLENIIQRIQSYFSVYRYTDTSRPVPVRTEAEVAAVVTMDGSGGGVGVGGPSYTGVNLQSSNNFVDAVAATPENEFISIGENDGFITVGEV